MPVSYEDKTADISGDPPPERPLTQGQMKGAAGRQVHQKQRGPQVATPSAGKEQAQHGKDEKKADSPNGKPADSGKDSTSSVPQDTPAPPPPQGNPIIPVDWKAKAAEDPWTVHQHGQYVASALSSLLNLKAVPEGVAATGEALNYLGGVYNAAADPNAIGQSVKNIWDQNTAAGNVAKWLVDVPGNPAALIPQIDMAARGVDEKQAVADTLGQALPLTANPTNVAMPESRLAQAAVFAGPSLVGALNAKNANDQSSQLAWAAVTAGLLSMGHLGALKGVLSDALGRWPEVEKTLDAIVQGRKDAQTKIQDPNTDHRLDWIDDSLKKGGFAGGAVSKLAPAAKEGERVLHEWRDPLTGEIKQVDATKADAISALKAVGVEDRQQLERRVIEGRLGSSTAKAIIDNWTAMGFKYDLNVVTKADSPLRDPLQVVRSMPAEAQAKGVRALTAAHGYIEQMARGHFVNDASPLASTWRSLIGVSRGTDAIDREGAAAMLDLAGHIDGNLLSKAIEGDRATYDALEPAGKAYVDIWRLLSNEERLARQRAGIPFAVGDYLWRVTKRPKFPTKGAGGGGILTTEAEKHRTLAPIAVTDAEGESRIAMSQAYEKISDANAAVARAREGALGHLTDWATPLSKEFALDPEAQAIRKLAQTDVAAAEQRAKDYTAAIFRDFETNSHRILARGGFGRQIKSIQTLKAINDLVDMKLTVPNPNKQGAQIVVNAAYRIGQNPRVDQLMQEAGYQRLQQGHFRDVLVHPDLANLIERGTRHGAAAANRPAALSAALEVESAALRLIMYQPAVHGWNVAGRFLAFAGMHAATDPVGLVTHLFGGGDAAALKQEAINAGVVNHGKYANFLPELYKQMGDALGEHDLFDLPLDAPEVAGHSAEVADLAGLGKPKMNFLERAQNLLWTKVDDFATAAYHIEKHSAMASGMTAEQAGLYAARRANSWAGYVASEDTNPMYHDAARLLMFAPSFWRTWGEIFLPLYKNSGVAVDSTVLKHMVKQEMALAASAIGVAYVTGNLLNVMASGQMQDHNEPQNRMKIEVRRPDFIRALQAVHYPGADKIDPTTGYGPNGEVLSLDNPLARFQKDVVGAAGLTSGHKDYQPSDTVDGLEQFATNRLSPFLSAAASIGNLDLYQSVKDHQARGVDPSSPAGRPTPTSLLSSLLYMTPNGSNLIHQITSSQNKATDLTLPGGAKIPAGVMKVAGALPPTAQGLLWQAMTGTTGPYTTAERTRGQTPSDDEYRKYAEIKTSYETKLASLDSEMAGGSITPSAWLTAYRKEHGTYIDQTGSFFMHAPEYAHGPTALTSDWEKLYTKAENPDGSLDPSKLAGLQAEWKQKHSPADYQAVQGQLAKSDRKYPMVGLYHKTIAAYTKWQEDWAAKNNIDVNQLRSDVRAYGAAYGDQAKSAELLRTHRDVALYERAKKAEFEHSPAGLMYGLYYQSSTVANYMRAYHLTAQQVVEQEQAAS